MRNVLLVSAFTLSACTLEPEIHLVQPDPDEVVERVAEVTASVPTTASQPTNSDVKESIVTSTDSRPSQTIGDEPNHLNWIDEELLGIAGVNNPAELFASPSSQATLIRALIRETFPNNYPVMLAIAHCESTGLIHWYPDGQLRPHSTRASSARGVFQVLANLHGPDIRSQGLDLRDPRQYMEWVRIMVDRRPSLSDWDDSRACWEARYASN